LFFQRQIDSPTLLITKPNRITHANNGQCKKKTLKDIQIQGQRPKCARKREKSPVVACC